MLMLDADHVPMPDALDAMVGYFDDERMALVQSPHDFFNHDSVQHYVVGRHEQSLFYRVVCPGKDRHGAAYWCGSAALIRRQALLEIGGVATETIAEDFHTTIRMLRHGWKSRYHDEVLVQGLAPHDLDSYLLQRDRWARGNLAVFTLPESPLRARELRPLQRLSYFASLAAYLAPPMRLLLLATLGLVLWTGELPMKISVVALAALWLPYVTLNLERRRGPRPRLHEDRRDRPLRAADDGDLHAGAALRLPPRPHRIQGDAEAGHRWRRARRGAQAAPGAALRGWWSGRGRCCACSTWPGSGRCTTCPAVAAVIVPLLGLIELRRIGRTLLAVGRRQQRRLIYRFEGDAPAQCFSEDGHVPGRLIDASAAGVGLVLEAPLAVGATPAVLLQLEDAAGEPHEVAAQVEVRSCREADGRHLVGATITEIDSASRMRLMEWCYVVCSHERLRGHRPAAPDRRARCDRAAAAGACPGSRRGRRGPHRCNALFISWGRSALHLQGGRRQYPCWTHGEVSERLKERDWKSRGRG